MRHRIREGLTAARLSVLATAVMLAAIVPRVVGQTTGQYTILPSWAELTPNSGEREWEMIAVALNASGSKLYAFRRADPPIVELDPATGKIVRLFGAGLFVWPHGIKVDREGFIWATDGTVGVGGARLNGVLKPAKEAGHGHQVIKFSPDGRVMLTLGTKGVAGDGPGMLNAPTDVAVAQNGDVFIADGHNGQPMQHPRVVKFSKDGRFIKAWGQKGTGPGDFSDPHCIELDSRGRVFVGDRGNKRIQIFDQDGKFLEEWRQFGSPAGISIAGDDTMVVADATTKNFTIGSARDGSVTATIDGIEADGPAVDTHGNIYAAEVYKRAVTKIVKR
jgi:streptogramin lyase